MVSWDRIYFYPGEDAMKIAEMTTKDLEYYINLVDRVAAEFERIDSNLERSSAVGKILSNSITCCREIIREKKSHFNHFSVILLFKIATATPAFTSHHPSQSVAISIKARLSISKKITHWRLRWWLGFLSHKVFLNSGVYIGLFENNATAYLTDYSKQLLCALRNKKINVIDFIEMLALLWWSGTKPAVSLRYIWTFMTPLKGKLFENIPSEFLQQIENEFVELLHSHCPS